MLHMKCFSQLSCQFQYPCMHPFRPPAQCPVVLVTLHLSTAISTTLRRQGVFPVSLFSPIQDQKQERAVSDGIKDKDRGLFPLKSTHKPPHTHFVCRLSLSPSYLSSHLKDQAPVSWYSVSLSFSNTHTPVTYTPQLPSSLIKGPCIFIL